MPKMLVNLDMTQNAIINVADPVSAQDVANKRYVDSVAQGLTVKNSVRAATVGDITLSGTPTVDDVVLVVGDRVLVKEQTNGINNGIYVVAAGAWTRAADYAAAIHAAGTFTFVEEGTTLGDSGWVCISDRGADTVATDALVYSQFSGAGTFLAGDGLTKTGNTISVNAAQGLTASAGGLSVNVDGSTVEIDGGNNIRVRSQGITSNELNSSAVTASNNALDSSVAGQGLLLNSGALTVELGAGLVFNGNAIEADTGSGYGVRKYVDSTTVTGAASVFTITHNLGTTAVQISLHDNSTGEIVIADVTVLSASQIRVTLGANAGAALYVVTVVG